MMHNYVLTTKQHTGGHVKRYTSIDKNKKKTSEMCETLKTYHFLTQENKFSFNLHISKCFLSNLFGNLQYLFHND